MKYIYAKLYSSTPREKGAKKILKKESQRKPVQRHVSITFMVVNEWINECKIKSIFFESSISTIDKLFIEEANRIKERVIEYTLQHYTEPGFNKILTEVTEYPGKEDTPEKTDIIFVFGSPKDYRINTVIKLFYEGLAHKILLIRKARIWQVHSKQK